MKLNDYVDQELAQRGLTRQDLSDHELELLASLPSDEEIQTAIVAIMSANPGTSFSAEEMTLLLNDFFDLSEEQRNFSLPATHPQPTKGDSMNQQLKELLEQTNPVEFNDHLKMRAMKLVGELGELMSANDPPIPDLTIVRADDPDEPQDAEESKRRISQLGTPDAVTDGGTQVWDSRKRSRRNLH